MRYVFVLFLSVSGLFMLMSNEWDVEKDLGAYDCSTGRFPDGLAVGFINCGTANPLVDALCAGCHGQEPQTDGVGNVISYSNIVDGANMNVLKVLDGATQVTEYVPGQEYTIELNMVAPGLRKGFNVSLCSTTTERGIFTEMVTDPIVQVANDASYTIATHTSNVGTDTWRWKWTAPSVTPGEVTFNILTLKDNAFANGWDSLFISSVQINPANASLTDHANWFDGIKVSAENNMVVVNIPQALSGSMQLAIFNTSGQSIHRTAIEGQKTVKITMSVGAGVYFVRLSNGSGQTLSKKVMLSPLN